MAQYYEKVLTGHWFDPRIKKTIEVYAITYEMSQNPSREKILAMELLADFPEAGDFDYIDEQRMEYEEDMPLYPEVEVATANRRQVSENS
jgi:hypothetical protein